MLYQLMGSIALVVVLGLSGLTAAEPVPAQEPVATSQQKDTVKADNVLGASEDDDEGMLDDDDEKISSDEHTFMNLGDDEDEDKDDDDDMN